ncbi:uncharacterized protein LOC133709048 [Rosa rugosa]|uniref:uncharacterized protein LOC133709048 n=1 Tax=Rosa rugosa TaxID=74645 RepID=UPI002B40C402|nr:uncharacterized protein LOC133709048 [Rosa rugosa]
MCGHGDETDIHVFKNCKALHCFWLLGPLKLKAKEHPSQMLNEWLFDMMDVLPTELVDVFFISLWSIWTERNNILWRNSTFQPMHLIQRSVKQLQDFQQVQPKRGKQKKRSITKWENPPAGRLKINIKGAFRTESGSGGIGVVVRDDLGRGIAAIARPFVHAHSALNMEAEACRAGLLLGIHQGWSEIDIESDSTLLVAALQSGEKNLSEIGRVLDDCKDYLRGFQSVKIRHIYREANGVALRLAHLASMFVIDDVWVDETPAIIQDVLYEDYPHCFYHCSTSVRGLGFTSPPMQISVIT